MSIIDNASVETSLGRTETQNSPLVSKEFTLAQLDGRTRGVSAEFSAAQLVNANFRFLGLERSLSELVSLKHVSKEFAAKLLRLQGLP